MVDRVDSSILCDSCGCWFHLKCVDLTRDEAQFVSRLEPKGVRWDCKPCDDTGNNVDGKQLDRIEKVVDTLKSLIGESLEPQFEAIKKSYATAVKNIEENSSVLVEAVRESTKQTVNEQKLLREKNMIIFWFT